ncbi:hypothetical protein J5N97_005087 [Dioscorea zingiberensis]|uniref:Uncharacterized protein n=1 Tax=Dioscorea zingiberensis TaxID=325984 RepID=A0A9D5HSE6_9LILI|nr:hypothetical protein J5N97_005087 [Dioscorea zingiberensis]
MVGGGGAPAIREIVLREPGESSNTTEAKHIFSAFMEQDGPQALGHQKEEPKKQNGYSKSWAKLNARCQGTREVQHQNAEMNGENSMATESSGLNESQQTTPEMAQENKMVQEEIEDEQKYGTWMDANQRRRGRGRGRGRGAATGGRGDGRSTRDPLERNRGLEQHVAHDRSLKLADDDHVSARTNIQRSQNKISGDNPGPYVRGGWSRGRYDAGGRGSRSQARSTFGDYMERDAPSIFNQTENSDPEANKKWEIAIMKGKGHERVNIEVDMDPEELHSKPHLITSISDTNMAEPNQQNASQEWRKWDPDPPNSHSSLVCQVTEILQSQEGDQTEEKEVGKHSREYEIGEIVDLPELDLEMEPADGKTSRGLDK